MEKFTCREKEVIKYLAKGYSNPQIAKILYVSTNTVKLYLKRIFLKMGVCNRVEAVVKAINTGIIKNIV